MVKIRKSMNEEASILWNIQKQAFLPLYEKYHDKANPYLRGIEDVAKRMELSMFRYYTILEDDEIVGGIVYRCRDFRDAKFFTVDFPEDLEK